MAAKKAPLAPYAIAAAIVLSLLGFIPGIPVLPVDEARAVRPTKITWEDYQPRWDVQAYVLYMKEEGTANYEPVTTVPLESCINGTGTSYPIKCETPIPYGRMSVGPKYFFVIRTKGPRGQMSVDSEMLTMTLGADIPAVKPPTDYTSVIPLNYDVTEVTTTGNGATIEKIVNADSSESYALRYAPVSSATTRSGVAWTFGGIGALDTANYQAVYTALVNMNRYPLSVDLSMRSLQTGLYWGRTLLLPALTYMEYNIPFSDFRIGFIEKPSDKKRADNSVIDELTFSLTPNDVQVHLSSGLTEPIRLQSIYFSR